MPRAAPGSDAAGNPRALIAFAVGLVIALGLAWYLRGLLLLIYASVIFAILLLPAVRQVERWRLGPWHPRRGAAIALVVALLLAGLALVLLVLLPPLISESINLFANWPQLTDHALGALQRVPGFHNVDFTQWASHLAAAGGWALWVAQNLASAVAAGFTILILTIYLVAEGQATRHWCLAFFPPAPRQRLAHTLDRGQRRMRGWLYGQASLALLLGVCSAVVFALLRVPYFYVLALASGLLTFVPLVGEIVAAALAAAVAGSVSWEKMVGVLIFFGIYQILDNSFLTPHVMHNAVDVPGLGIIIALAVGAALGGVLGAALAIPSAALAAELLKEYAHAPG